MRKEDHKMSEDEIHLLCETFPGLTPEDLEIAEVVSAEDFIRELDDLSHSLKEGKEKAED